jgi:hypothetical protein
MFTSFRYGAYILTAVMLMTGAFAWIARADHSWGGYHWARTSNPFTLQLADNVAGTWDDHLREASGDWSASSVLNTAIVNGNAKNAKNCRPTAGRVEVCNAKYGNNGWLGVAQIWISGSHITQGVAKMNDTYFDTPTYNTWSWRQLVMCQEVAHAFGLDHQDEDFSNENLGTCMDYTSDPVGNERPNGHDFDELEDIYAHLDSTTTLAGDDAPGGGKGRGNKNLEAPTEWGKAVREDARGRTSLYERDFGGGKKLLTFVFWAE